MGDLAIAPSDTMQIWAGTGEEDSRNSISPGGGIYKSTDGGLTWKLMGLEKTETIGRIIVHPTNPNIVWVAALGAIWRSNPERGLYKTTDGGQTWRVVKFISDKAGFVDMVIHPQNPNVLFASSWERVRGPYFLKSGGPGSALWKSIDGGESWTEVKGGGFPETEKGRIGIAIAHSDPRIMYTMVEAAPVPASRTLASGAGPAVAPPAGGRGGAPGEQRKSGLYRSLDGGQTWEYMNGNNTRPFYYSQVRVDTKNPNRVYFSSVPINFSDDGGKTVRNTAVGVHTDDHALWIDPNDPDRMVIGNDGGVAVSFDRGGNWASAFHIPVGQFYAVSFDMATPYRVCGGLQDNYSWCGPSRKSGGAITNARLVPREWRRRLLHGAGSARPEHHLFRIAGRQHGPSELRDGRARDIAEAQLARFVPTVSGLDRAVVAGHDRAAQWAGAPAHCRPAPARVTRLGRPGAALQLEHALPALAAQRGCVLRRRQPRAQVDQQG